MTRLPSSSSSSFGPWASSAPAGEMGSGPASLIGLPDMASVTITAQGCVSTGTLVVCQLSSVCRETCTLTSFSLRRLSLQKVLSSYNREVKELLNSQVSHSNIFNTVWLLVEWTLTFDIVPFVSIVCDERQRGRRLCSHHLQAAVWAVASGAGRRHRHAQSTQPHTSGRTSHTSIPSSSKDTVALVPWWYWETLKGTETNVKNPSHAVVFSFPQSLDQKSECEAGV